MGLVNELFTIKIEQNTATLALALNDNQFYVAANQRRVVFTDSKIKADADGKYIIDLSPLGLGIKETKVPKDVMERRAKIREVNTLEKNAIFIDRTVRPFRYFYREGGQLRVLQGDNQIIGGVEIVYGKPVIKADSLLGPECPYLELPPEVVREFEGILEKKELQKVVSKLTLSLAGKSLLDGKKYYGFQVDEKISQDGWNQVWNLIKERFEFFEGDDNLQGWLTSEPGIVSEILGGIPVKADL
jgi:hypothetical protein